MVGTNCRRLALINIDHDYHPIANLDSPLASARPILYSCVQHGSRINIMGKRHPNLPAWQWRAYPNNHQHPTNLVLHLIAVPLFILGFC
jgi:hypothetical protein